MKPHPSNPEVWATTVSDLAGALGISRDTFYQWRRRPDAPKKHKQGFLIPEWVEFAKTFSSRPVAPEQREISLRLVRAEYGLRRQKLEQSVTALVQPEALREFFGKLATGYRATFLTDGQAEAFARAVGNLPVVQQNREPVNMGIMGTLYIIKDTNPRGDAVRAHFDRQSDRIQQVWEEALLSLTPAQPEVASEIREPQTVAEFKLGLKELKAIAREAQLAQLVAGSIRADNLGDLIAVSMLKINGAQGNLEFTLLDTERMGAAALRELYTHRVEAWIRAFELEGEAYAESFITGR